MVWSNSIPNPLAIGGNGQIGSIILFDANGNVVGEWIPSEFSINNADTNASITIDTLTDDFPSLTFKTSASSQIAFINVSPDTHGNPQLGVNSTPYTDPLGVVVYERMFMADNNLEIGMVKLSDQTFQYGILIRSNNIIVKPYIGLGTAWQPLTFFNGWGWFGNPFWPPAALALPDGTTQLRGVFVAGDLTNGTIVANIPSTDANGNLLRPIPPTPGSTNGRLMILTAGDNTGVAGMSFTNKVFIDPNGNISLAGSAAGTSLSIDNIRFGVRT